MKKLITLILIVFCLTGCANHNQEKDKVTIVASNFPAYDFARQIAGRWNTKQPPESYPA